MVHNRTRYTVNVRPRLLDKWVAVLDTDDIDAALAKAEEAYNAGNAEALVWDNTRNGWYVQQETGNAQPADSAHSIMVRAHSANNEALTVECVCGAMWQSVPYETSTTGVGEWYGVPLSVLMDAAEHHFTEVDYPRG